MKAFFNIKKYLCLALCAVLLIGSTGCGVVTLNRPYAPEESGEDTTAPIETQNHTELDVVEGGYDSNIENYLKRLGDADYEKAAVKMVTTKKHLVVPAEDAGKIISDDMKERNDGVESTLNISIVVDERDPYTLLDEVKASVRSGDFYAHTIMYPQDMIGSFVASGAILNMKSLPGFETDIGYFHHTGVSAATGGDALYAVAGEATLDRSKLPAVFFNKNMLEKAGLESPYELVDSGEWTIDKYAQYISAASALEGDFFGYTAGETSAYLIDLFYFASGQRLTESSFGYYPTYSIGKEGLSNVVENIRPAVDSSKATGNALTARETFKGGNVLFMIANLDFMSELTYADFDWGILPLPKANKEQEKYYSLAFYDNAMFMSALPTTPDFELTADFITCMNILSYGYSTEAYITNAAYYHLRDNQSIRMLAHIVENPVYDLAYSFASNNIAIPSITFTAVRNAVSGVSTLETYINRWSYRFESAMYYLFDVEE